MTPEMFNLNMTAQHLKSYLFNNQILPLKACLAVPPPLEVFKKTGRCGALGHGLAGTVVLG